MRRWKLMLTLALAVAVGAALLWPRDDRPRPQRLPDGSVLKVKSVSFGKRFSYAERPPKAWQLAIGQRLPYGLAAWLGWRFDTQATVSLSAATPQNRIDLAGGRKAKTSSPVIPDALCIFWVREGLVGVARDGIRVIVLDGEGDSLVEDDGGGASSASLALDEKGLHYHELDGWSVPAHPRRDKNIIVRFLREQGGGQSDAPIVEFRVPNPKPGPYPTWTPEPWPAKKSDGDLNVTLAYFATGLSESDPTRPAAKDEQAITLLKLAPRQSGPPHDWRVNYVEISDATGNCWRPFLLNRWPGPDEPDWMLAVAWRGKLWASESAWKLKIELAPLSNDAEKGETRVVQFLAKPQTAK